MRSLVLLLHALLFSLVLFSSVLASDLILIRSSGSSVLGIEVEGARISKGELRALVPFSEGSLLNPELVREGIINFHRTGLYEMVEVLLSEAPGGINIKYLLSPKKWLEQVEFEGNLRLDDRELLSRVDLRSSEEITEDKLAKNVDRLADYYRFRGFTGTRISYRIVPGEDNRTGVVFRVSEGDRNFISDVRLTGDAGISRTKLLSLIVSMPGSTLDGEKLESDIRRVREHLRKKMFLVPVLSYTIDQAADFSGASSVTFRIDRGPYFLFQVQIDDENESKKLLKRMRSVFLKSTTPEKAKFTMEKRVLDQYRNAGFPFTSVALEDRTDNYGSRTISLVVDRGLIAQVGHVRLDGVRFLPENEAAGYLGLVTGQPYVKEKMEEGIEKLELKYRSEGFLSTVFTRQPLNFVPREGYQEVDIHLVAQEGPRHLIGQLMVNESPLPDERTVELLGFGPGDPYVPEVINTGRDNLLRELGSMGYLYAAVTVIEPDIRPEDSVDLSITVTQGPRVRLGTVIITGNESVNTKIIRTALDLKRGEILTRDKLLKAQERIYDLKVMTSVDVQLADPQTPGGNKDLMVRVKERPKYVVGFRAGYGSEDKLRGEVSVTNRNFMGMARSLSLRGEASDIERGTTLLYSHPWFQSLPMDMTLSLSDLVEERESYSRDSLSIAVDFVRGLSEKTESRFGYFFEGLRLFDVSPDAQLSPDDEGKTDVAALVGEILHDARDDFLDPWSGVLGDIIVEYAASGLGSKTEYIKTELAVRRYMNPVDDIVLAGLLRLGRVQAYGQSEEVIISKRFFLGGQNSVRGYRLDSLGPRDADGDPVGGNYLLNANLELRYPLYKSLRGVVFLDSGSVWLENASDPEDEKFKLRTAAGGGIRWTSPIGPLSLDYGYKLNPAEGDEDRSRIHFSIGHAF